MALGPGKYDDLCTDVRERAGAEGVLLIVLEGKDGNGFSAQISPEALLRFPELLENIAAQMRADRDRMIGTS
jgi:hypothetical protein